VHDSDGLQTQTGTGEWAWRPLVNPHTLRVNRFMDEHPRGFRVGGSAIAIRLTTRTRESYFYLRPSYWIEPLGDWGKGGVELVEIPTDEEIHDNIVAYWVPEAPVQPKKAIPFSYLLYAHSHSNHWPPGGRVVGTRTGGILAGPQRSGLAGGCGGWWSISPAATSMTSTQRNRCRHRSRPTVVKSKMLRCRDCRSRLAWRVAFKLKPGSDKPVDLRCYLTLYGEALTETWTYLWKPTGGA